MRSILMEKLEENATKIPLKVAYIESNCEEEGSITFKELWDNVRKLAGFLKYNGLQARERVMLCFPSGIEYVTTFLACNYLGIIPIPLDIPNDKQDLEKWENIAENATVKCVIISQKDNNTINILKEKKRFQSMKMYAIDFAEICEQEEENDVLFLQYTSGSTGYPKGVIITNDCITAQLEAMKQVYYTDANMVFVNWLPFVHDTGLILGVLYGLYCGCTSIIMDPYETVNHPVNWANSIYRYQGTHTVAPNFAYELLADTLEKTHSDVPYLQSLQLALNAGEPTRVSTFQHFNDIGHQYGMKGNVMVAAFGMAESVLAITLGKLKEDVKCLCLDNKELEKNHVRIISTERISSVVATGEKNSCLISCGTCIPEHTLTIRTTDGKTCPAFTIGEICAAGATLAGGYWNKTSITNEVYVIDEEGQRYLKTGDMGFCDEEGNLYITGRKKDIIIIQGTNIYPQDVEKISFSTDCCCCIDGSAAFEVADRNGTEQIILVQEAENTELSRLKEVGTKIQKRLLDKYNCNAKSILFVKQGTIARTSGGKIQRSSMKEKYITGELNKDIMYSYGNPDNLEKIIIERESDLVLQLKKMIAYELNIIEEAVGTDELLMHLGISSSITLKLCNKINTILNCSISVTAIFNYNTVSKLAKYIWNKKNYKKKSYSRNSNTLEDCTVDELIEMIELELGGAVHGRR